MSLATAIATDSTLLTLDKKLRQRANVPSRHPDRDVDSAASSCAVTRARVYGSRSRLGANPGRLREVDLVRDGVVLAYDDSVSGDRPLVFVHGAA
jgi:hypothetical protein